MKKFLMVLVLLATPLLTLAQDEAARRAAGCGPNEIQFDVKTDKKHHPKGEEAPGKALVYVFDNRGGVGIGWPPARVGVDGTWVGANFKASYFFFSVAPGEHNLCSSAKEPFAKSTNESLLATTFTAEAGQTYYFAIQYYPDPGWKSWEISPAEGQLEIGKLPFSTFTQKGGNPPNH
jgi:hypothetical protein